MILKNKKALIASSLLILLPIVVGLLLWDSFPEQMATHWGMTGEADGWSSVPFAVFFPPLILLIAHWLCILCTALDKGNRDRNRKPLTMVLWIIPFLSNFTSCIMYALALGAEFSPVALTLVMLGLMFAVIGNYLPKCKMNSTMGIKVPWTYTSEENWNATHRFGGRVWVIGGIVMALSAFLPGNFSVVLMLVSILALTVIPIVYSYRYYKTQLVRGDALTPISKIQSRMTRGTVAALVCLLLFVAVVLFVGDLAFEFGEDALTVKGFLYSDLIVDYASVEAIEYREGNVPGFRVGGYGSFRLLMGYFQNEEFGIHTRYTYYRPEACIVLTWRDKTVVLSAEDAAQTQALYQELLSRTAG